MAKPPLPESPTQQTEEAPLEDSFYEIPAELQDGAPPAPPRAAAADAPDEDEAETPPHKPRFPVALVSAGALAAICIVGGLVAYRCYGQRQVVREGIAQAERLLVLDTAENYRKAANLLAPLSRMDPLHAGSARAFALAMLACDYRDAAAEEEANKLLVIPGRADRVPQYASLAFRALALGRGQLADAALDRNGTESEPGAELPWGKAISARVALAAGTYESALEDATTAAAAPGFVAGLAVHGDALRRARRDYRSAVSAYEAALAVSATHPRAAFGLAKLALSGQAPEAEARAALGRMLAAGEATPRRERARAVLHLGALRIRGGDPVDVVRQELGGGFDTRELDWLMGAARAEAANRGAYRAVADTPSTLQSSNDDDLEDKGFHALSPEPPPPPPPPPPAVEKPAPPRPPAHAAKHAAAPKHGGKAAKAVPARGAKASKASSAKATTKAAAKKASAASKASPKKKPKKPSR